MNTSKRNNAAVKVVNTINSCRTPDQIKAAGKLIELFERMYDDTLPLRRWLLHAAFEINYQQSKTTHTC